VDAWAEWIWLGAADALIALLVGFALQLFLPRSRRRLWCGVQRRVVDVEFEECGLPGFRLATDVKRCSAFDPPTAVACGRWCLDRACRRRWAAIRLAAGR